VTLPVVEISCDHSSGDAEPTAIYCCPLLLLFCSSLLDIMHNDRMLRLLRVVLVLPSFLLLSFYFCFNASYKIYTSSYFAFSHISFTALWLVGSADGTIISYLFLFGLRPLIRNTTGA
jgi:hypothetical protein